MRRFISLVCLSLATSALASLPASASKVVALVMGNAATPGGPEDGVMQGRLEAIVKELRDRGNGTMIIGGQNLSHEKMQAALLRFQDEISKAEIAFVYYTGPGASRQRENFLVPTDWGQDSGKLVPVNGLLGGLRDKASGKTLVFLETTASPSWSSSSYRPGFSGLDEQAGGDKLLITYARVLPGLPDTRLNVSDALVNQLTSKTMKLTRLASLVQDDLSFASRGLNVPRVMGAIHSDVALLPLQDSKQLSDKQKVCTVSLDGNQDAKTTASAPVQIAAAGGQSRWYWMHCPDTWKQAPSARVVPKKPT